MAHKYIIVDNGVNYFPVLFPEFIDHAEIAKKMGGEVVGAGFFSVDRDTVFVNGKSLSLNIGPGDGDKKMIARILGLSTSSDN